VFTATYDRDCDPIANVFIESPEVVMASLSCTVTDASIRYLNRITGRRLHSIAGRNSPRSGLAVAERAYRGESIDEARASRIGAS